MENILFIIPPNIKYESFVNPPENVKAVSRRSGTFGAVITDMPLGVMSLSAYLKKHAAVKTELIDFNVELNKTDFFEFNSFAEFFDAHLSQWRRSSVRPPGIIGISALFTPSYQNMVQIARSCRKVFPDSLIVAGGGVPTNMYKEIFATCESFDALCLGEGEKPLLRLIEATDGRGFLEEDSSWITRQKVQNGDSFQYDFIENLDEIPFLDYEIFDLDNYTLNPTISAYPTVDSRRRGFPLMTSRGCTHHCCFCAAHTVRGRKMRYYGIERLRLDLERLRKEYGAETIIFQDDHFMADKQRAHEVIGILRELGMTGFFPNSLDLYALDRKILEALKSVGVNQLVLAIESGSNRVLKEIMHKPLNLSIVERVVKDCRELGIYTDVNILIGLPGETGGDIEDARIFLRSVGANWFRINVATPLVGSEMLDICLKKDYIKGNYIDCDYKKAIVETEDFTSEYIQEMAYVLNLDLNFVNNSDFRLGDYRMALKGFANAIRAKSDHAIAHYYMARSHDELGDRKRAQTYMDEAKRIVAESPFWRKYVDMFNIPL